MYVGLYCTKTGVGVEGATRWRGMSLDSHKIAPLVSFLTVVKEMEY